MAPLIRIWRLLDAKQRRAAIVVLGLTVVGMLAETVSLGLVIPALAVLTSEGSIPSDSQLHHWLTPLGGATPEELMVGAVLALVLVFLLKTLFLAFLIWWQTRFSLRLQVDLSYELFAGYLRQPWTFHLQRNSALLIRNVITEVSVFTGVIQGTTLVLTEGLAALGIWILLLVAEPAGALIVASTLGLAGWIFHRATKEYVGRWGEARQHHEGLRMQHLQQGFGGVKEVKLLGREAEFLARYSVHNVGTARVNERQITVANLPRLWLELLGVVGLGALVMVLLWLGRPLNAVVPTLGLFAAAAFRLMPSLNRVISAVQTIRYGVPVITLLERELPRTPSPVAGVPGLMPALQSSVELEAVSFRYPESTTLALVGANISISRGSTVGFIGGSGAGKSTLVDVLLGLLPPTTGRVLVDGVDIRTDLSGWQRQIGYVPQSIFLTDDTLRRNVAFGLPDVQIDEARIWRAIGAAQLEAFLSELPQGLDAVVGERGVRLSGGQRQRIGIARALYHDPGVLVLDEATSALDVVTERDVMRAVDALHGQKTIVIVAHRLSTVAHCDLLFRLDHGEVVETGETTLMLEKLAHVASKSE